MNYELKKNRIGVLALFLIVLMVLFAGCATPKVPQPTDQDVEKLFEPKLITGISVSEDSESINVLVTGNSLLTYTSVKQPVPLSVVLYFPETALSNVSDITPDSDTLGLIQASDLAEKHTARIEIALKKDVSYEVTREGMGIKTKFARTLETSASDQPDFNEENLSDESDISAEENIPTATELLFVAAEPFENSVAITVRADGAIKDYQSFTLKNPPRIVFDIFNIESPYKKEQAVAVNTEWVKQVRHYGYPDKVRLVLDTYDPYLSAFSARSDQDGLLIKVGADQESAATEKTEEQILAQDSQSVEPAIKESEVKQTKPAWVNRIDFSSEDAGKSTIIIGTTTPVKYDINKASNNKLDLKLYNTRIPDYRQRPLITTRFESAVDRIIPFEAPADNSVIAIELRESVPYFVEQTDNILLLHFEASAIPPKPFEQTKLPHWKKVLSQADEDIIAKDTADTEAEGEGIAGDKAIDQGLTESVIEEIEEKDQKKDSDKIYRPGTTQKYIGEKIALDFYKTDIKNAFRILKEVSGKNFAIDKDVTGEVTLSIDKPVPWDQVLDLILKMNQLGMVYEGDIVRIATLESIKKEDDIARAQIASETATKKEIEALEPLVTEYILISYSDANNVLQHVEKIKSERGKVSMDARTSQIIMSDTAERIERARAVVKELDKVTPQVIIEARIVEVTSNFSRNLGIEWGAATTPRTYGLGGALDLDVAMNYSVPSTGNIGIKFARAFGGTPLTLDATLHAAEAEGDSKIISSPKIVTLDHKQATITQGLEYPYLERDDAGGSSVKFKAVDLKLAATPHVTPDNRIRLELDITKNDVAALVGGVPSLATNTATTELLVNDGDTIVIGGIIKSSDTSGNRSFPGLGKIPIIGYLFRSESKDKQRNELLIFITPRIVQLEQQSGS